MCTIMTFDRKTFDENRDAIVKQLAEDVTRNNEGFSLILAGASNKEVSVLRSMTILPIVELICNSEWKRFWLHCRFATTTAVGINQTHAFQGGEWHVMHNGYIQHPKAGQFKVDSELIPKVISDYGVGAAIGLLLHQESFANVFLVNLYTGTWYVVRCSTGSLYTDGKGNYSTNKIENTEIQNAVTQYTESRFRMRWPSEEAKKKSKKKGKATGGASKTKHYYHAGHTGRTHKTTSPSADDIPPVNEEHYWHPEMKGTKTEAELGYQLPDDYPPRPTDEQLMTMTDEELEVLMKEMEEQDSEDNEQLRNAAYQQYLEDERRARGDLSVWPKSNVSDK